MIGPDHGQSVALRSSTRTIARVASNPDRASYFPAIERKYGQPMTYWFEQMAEIKDRKYPEQMAFLQENHGFSRTHANALVQYSRGSTSSRRYATVEDYLEPFDEAKRAKVREIFAALTSKYPTMHSVVAWNHPMLKFGDDYIMGVSVHANHILIAPWGADVIAAFASRLTAYEVNKKTIKVPVDWKVDKRLLRDLAARRLAELEH